MQDLGVGEGVVETVPMEDGGLIVDVVQSYLDSWQCSNTLDYSTERKHDREVERRATISLVDRWVDLEVGPRDEARCMSQ